MGINVVLIIFSILVLLVFLICGIEIIIILKNYNKSTIIKNDLKELEFLSECSKQLIYESFHTKPNITDDARVVYIFNKLVDITINYKICISSTHLIAIIWKELEEINKNYIKFEIPKELYK